jgi:hypothetical protein
VVGRSDQDIEYKNYLIKTIAGLLAEWDCRHKLLQLADRLRE